MEVRSLVEKFMIKKFAVEGRVKLTPKNVPVLSKIISEYSIESENTQEICQLIDAYFLEYNQVGA